MSRREDNQIAEIGKKLTSPSLTKDAAIKLLKQLANLLPEIEQLATLLPEAEQSLSTSTIQTLKPCMDALVLPSLLKHKDKDVRVLVATCLSEIMRIRAPHAPYSDGILLDIFQLIVNTFQGLDEVASPAFARRVSILETVAKVKTCLLMLDLECDELIHEMFTIFFAKIREDHPPNVFAAMRTIMALVLEESFEIPQALLDILLSNLLKEKAGSSAIYKLAVAVLQSCAEKLEPYVQRLLTSVMLEGKAPDVTLHEDYHALIYEIYCCAPQMILAVIPNLSQELLTDNIDVRLKAVKLLGRLFAFPGRHVAQEYRQLFTEFLKRFTDKSVEVRLATVECARNCIMANPVSPEATDLLSGLNDRLLDFDDKVRMAVVKAICEVAKTNIKWVPISIMKHVADRLRDKKIFVRKDTLQNLTEVYATYCTNCFEESAPPDPEIEWIPSKILRCCYDKDCRDFKPQGVEIVLTEDLFHSEVPVKERVKHWIAAFSNFDKNDKKALERVLSQKKRLQEEMQVLLSLRQRAKDEDASEFQKKLQTSIKVAAASFVDPTKAEENFQKLFQMKDNNIFKALGLLLVPGTSFAQSRSACNELLKRVGEKHPQHDFMHVLAIKCSFCLFGKEHVSMVLNEVKSSNAAGNKELVAASLSLLVEFSGVFPLLVDGAEDDLLDLLKEDGDEFVKEGVVHVLAKAGSSIRDRLGDFGGSLDLTLENLCMEGSRKQAKYAVSAIAAMSSDFGLKSLSVLYGRLVDSLEDNNHLATKLESLSCIAQCAMPVFETREDEVIRFVVRNLLRRNSSNLENKSNWESRSNEALLKIYGIKTLVKSFLPNKDGHLRQRLKGLCGVLLKLLQCGEISEDVLSSEIDKAHLRLAAAKAVLRLARKWDLQIPPQLFQLTVSTAQDPCVQARRQFLLKANQYLRERVLPNKYASTFALSAVDSVREVISHSKRFLAEFVDTSRREAHLRQAAASLQVEGHLLPYHPEYVLVYLIHVLAHQPSFPESDETSVDASVYEPFYRELLFFLRVLLQQENDGKELGKKEHLDNFPATLEIFRTIKRAEDATENSRTNSIRILCDVGLVLTKDLGRKKLYSGAYPGEVPLPSMFYKPPDAESDILLKTIDGSHLPPCLTEDVFARFRSSITTRLPQSSSPQGQKRVQREMDDCSSSDEVGEDIVREKDEGIDVPASGDSNVESMGICLKVTDGAKRLRQGKLTLQSRESLRTLNEEGDKTLEVKSICSTDEAVIPPRKKGRPSKRSRESQFSDVKNNLKDEGSKSLVRPRSKASTGMAKTGDLDNNVLVSTPSLDENEEAVNKVSVHISRTSSRKQSGSRNVGGQRTVKDIFQHRAVVKQASPAETLGGIDKEALQAEHLVISDTTPKKLTKRPSGKDAESPSWKNEDEREANEKLIGSRIKVWWPLDKRYYEGKVISYEPSKQRHKVLYNDGDEEFLRLGKERWEVVGGTPSVKKNVSASVVSSAPSDQHGKQKRKTNINLLARVSDLAAPSNPTDVGDEQLSNLEAEDDISPSQSHLKVASNGSTKISQSQALPTGSTVEHTMGAGVEGNVAEPDPLLEVNESDDEPLDTWRSRRRKVY